MKKRYFYEFNGRVYLEANDQTEAEELVTGIPLENYLIDEELYEVDDNYVPCDIKVRRYKLNSHYHPIEDGKKHDEFRRRECKYGNIINEFLHGLYNKKELIKRMEEADENDDYLDDCPVYGEIKFVDLKSKKDRIIRLVSID